MRDQYKYQVVIRDRRGRVEKRQGWVHGYSESEAEMEACKLFTRYGYEILECRVAYVPYR